MFFGGGEGGSVLRVGYSQNFEPKFTVQSETCLCITDSLSHTTYVETKQEVDVDNSNSNHSAEAVVTRKRAASKEPNLVVTVKNKRARESKVKEQKSDYGQESDREEINERARVNEDLDTVIYEVSKSSQDFTSDGEIDSDEENSADQSTLDESIERYSEQECTETSDEETEDPSSQSTEGYRNKRRKTGGETSTKKRQSVEDKLDTLSNTLMAMQDMMLKKGFFDEDTVKQG